MMFHGVIIVNHAEPAGYPKDIESVRHEMVMSVAGGSGLQEIYITPDLLTSEMWDCLAETIKWGRENADILKDTHWVGGSPGKGEIYGYAAWHPVKGGIITLRNPSAKAQTIRVDIAKVLELTPDAPKTYKMKSPWSFDKELPSIRMTAGQETAIEMQPFTVITLQGIGE